ncbi:helix-turn-helix domain-containing protein [Lentzea sp. CC55]|uniref:nSTAND1 domain-containing NTPase n=1 Tax=Lentzea sp. CC55 TaxID=2884909 RepID=UPI001F1A766C|nr:helix-turn-helix transcriptional regulator [Lentzea sp. CC55]MCG8924608.1 helix-turn-helix domain-containing protein [Lentzea sp. CC55]
MPRTERPLDCEDTELGAFAADLRRLREKAGRPSYRALASRAHYSAATLSDAAGGKKLPSLAVTLAYVTACEGDAEEWERRWRAIAAPPDRTTEAPYVGLKAFQEEDADRFHGREKLTAKLVELTRARPFVGVFGASGSGKSSLLRAGLIPRLPRALIFTPGVQPLDECAVRLARLTGQSAVALSHELADPAALGLLLRQLDEELVLVVDQFEEVFTLCGPEQRDWFVRALVGAPHVVIGVRADFYGHVGRHPELVEALEDAQVLVGPLTTDELRRAITEPALHVGATVESALVIRLVADVVGQASALPLVQHALVETWHRRRGMTLSLAGYEEAGGVEHAVARTAESVHEQLSPQQRQIARRTFLRLIALGEGIEDTKRRANREDLDAEVLERLATARLVTLTEQHAELTHEALIRSWPRLREWIDEDRNALRVHHQLTEAAAQWDGDRDLLYKGARLAQAAELDPESLTGPERAFLTASQADGRRRARRTRVVVSVLSVLVVLLASSVVFAVVQAGEATRQRNDALAGRAATEVMRLLPTDPDKAARLALAAHAVTPATATRDAVLNADAARWSSYTSTPQMLSWPEGDFLTLSTNSEFFLGTLGSGVTSATVLFRGRTPGDRLARVGERVNRTVLSGDDRRAFTLEATGDAQVWDVARPEEPHRLGTIAQAPADLTVSRDGTAAAGVVRTGERPRHRAVVWDLRDPARPAEVAVPVEHVLSAAMSPSGREIALLRKDNGTGTAYAEIWVLDGPTPRRGTSIALSDEPLQVVTSAGGRALAVRFARELVVWKTAGDGEPVRVPVGSSQATAVFGDDDRKIAVQTEASVEVWDVGGEGPGVRAGSFGGFRGNVHGLRYRDREQAFGVVDSTPSMWALHTDFDKVVRGLCREREAALSDEDWAKYFPGVDRVPVC